jgi:hypothetical protein
MALIKLGKPQVLECITYTFFIAQFLSQVPGLQTVFGG